MVNRMTASQQNQKAKFILKPMVVGVRLALAGMIVSSFLQPVQADLPVPAGTVDPGVAAINTTGSKMDITQKIPKAVLNWQSFDIGVKNHVQYHQPNVSSVALNRIGQNNPSKILGKLTANGQIYLINKNGFVFGKDSVIDVNSLIASTHNITDDVFERGITRVFDDTGEAAFVLDEQAIAENTEKLKKILIEKGAKITTGDNSNIIIVAPEIENQGEIETGKFGQIMMVASQDKVYLQQTDSNEKDFAGLLVEVDTGGKVSNFGDLLAKQGNITMAGFMVQQAGQANATTSVNVNGSIRLLAREGQDTQGGTKLIGTDTLRTSDLDDGLGTEARLILADNSLTTITADDSSGVGIDEEPQPDSFLEFSAHRVEFKNGSQVLAPSAKIDIKATSDPDAADPSESHTGRLVMEQDSVIDVSGVTDVQVAMERNVGVVDATTTDLRDSPFQRDDGILAGEEIFVDLRKDTEIIDTSGAQSRVERTVFERLSEGGEITMTAAEVDIKDGAQIDISGGSVEFQEGEIKTTQLTNQLGETVNISDADPNDHFIEFDVAPDDPKVNLQTRSIFEPGYKEGKDAGSLSIETANLAWNGILDASVTNGRFQRTPETMAKGGKLDIDLTVFDSAQSLSFQNGEAMAQLALSGIQDFSLKTFGDISIADDVSLDFSPLSRIDMEAGNLEVYGELYSAGGSVNLTAVRGGDVVLADGGQIDVSGRWVNDYSTFLKGQNSTEAIVIDGGSVSLVSQEGDVITQQGSSIRADGGAHLSEDKSKLTAGSGGSIELAVRDIGNTESSLLHFNADVSARSLTENGRLVLASNQFEIGAKSSLDVEAGVNYLSADDPLFSGFSDISIESVASNLDLTEGTVLDLTQQNWQLLNDYEIHQSGQSLTGFTESTTLPEFLRSTSNLSLTALGLSNNVSMGQSSSILAEAGSSISLTASGSVFVDGTISTPGGDISLNIDAISGGTFDSTQAIWLGENADLQAQGKAIYDTSADIRTASVLDGGNITLNAERGYIVIKEGADLDVSGTSAIVDLPLDDSSSNTAIEPALIGSDAGKIRMVSAQGMVLQGTLKGAAGTNSNRAGSLHIELDRSKEGKEAVDITFPDDPLMVAVSQSGELDFGDEIAFGDTLDPLLTARADVSADRLNQGAFDFITLKTPDTIQFTGDIQLSAGVSMGLDAESIAWQPQTGQQGGQVNLEASYLSMGSSLHRNAAGQASGGDGIFNFNGDWIELYGGIRLDGFETVNITSRNDIRARGIILDTNDRDFVGELLTAGDINFTASQLYPTSLSRYQVSIENNDDGVINISAVDGNNSAPLSGGGEMTFKAPHIYQGGRLLAPLGKINLEAEKTLRLAAGSLTSVSADGLLIPLGLMQGGQGAFDWLYPLRGSRNLLLDATPEKRISLKAPALVMEAESIVDDAGGGDIFAYQFEPGRGGSFDFLDPDSEGYHGSFAVLPGLATTYAPYDHFQTPESGYLAGETVVLNGGEGLGAGEYVKLPAHYALLPDAFLITPVAGSTNQRQNSRTLDGREIMTGYSAIADTRIRDAYSSGFMVENGDQIRKRGTYHSFVGDEFFVQQAERNETAIPLLARDSGLVSIQAQTRLIMEGVFNVGPAAGGIGGRMEIGADNIRVTNVLSEQSEQGFLEILASNLSGLNISSLLLGGERQSGAAKDESIVSAGAETVSFESGAALEVTDLIVVAKDTIDVKEGAIIAAAGEVDSGDRLLTVDGDGALMRVSASEQVDFRRTGSSAVKGKLLVAEGATLKSDQSILLDSTLTTDISGEIVMDGGSLNLSTNSINIGEVEEQNSAGVLNLSNADLSRLRVDELVLTSRDAVNFYGSSGQLDTQGLFQQASNGGISPLQFNRLVINAAGLSGHAVGGDSSNESVNLKVAELVLKNTQEANSVSAATGTGSLNIETESFTLGDGRFGVAGFDQVNVSADRQFKTDGVGTLAVDADFNLKATVVTASGRSDYEIDVSGHKAELTGTGHQADLNNKELGGKLKITADQIALKTHVDITSGQFNLEALGDVELGENAIIDLSGSQFDFADVTAYSGGGIFDVKSENGSIYFAQGSSIDLNGGDEQHQGGSLKVEARQGNAFMEGAFTAQGGSFDMDVSGFKQQADMNNLLAKLADAGVTQSINYQSREEDIIIAAESSVTAEHVSFTADKGLLTVAGSINADSEDNSSIKLHAGDDVILTDGALLSARTQSENEGGKVLLSSLDVDQDGLEGISIQQGSAIHVGNAQGKQGEVVLRASRSANGVINISAIEGEITGYAGRTSSRIENIDSNGDGNNDQRSITHFKEGNRFYAEGIQVYEDLDGQVTETDIAQYKADADNYMTESNRLAVQQNLHQDMSLRPGIEVRYQGDLTVKDEINTVDWRYASLQDSQHVDNIDGVQITTDTFYDATVGRLSLKASENLQVDANISDGFRDEFLGFTEIKDKLQDGDSWSFDLVSGADLSSPEMLAVLDSGDLTMGSGVKVRTGSGDLRLAAAEDVTLTDQSSVIYNAGRPDPFDPYGSLSDAIVEFSFYSEYPLLGGDILISAKGDVNGAETDQFVNEWLFRQGSWTRGDDHSGEIATSWGVSLGYMPFGFFNQNQASSNKPLFEQNIGSFGGGNVNVMAGGDIKELSIMMPTTGKQIGKPENEIDFLTNEIEINGGGNMNVFAGRDIVGGTYLLGRGKADIAALGSVAGTQQGQFKNGLILAIGDTQVDMTAKDGVQLAAVIDPMMIHKFPDRINPQNLGRSGGTLNFFSYSDQTAVNISSLNGDIFLGADQGILDLSSSAQKGLALVYPGTLTATALDGSVLMKDDLTLFPAPQGDLRLLAQNEIGRAKEVERRLSIGMSDADRTLLPVAEFPEKGFSAADRRLLPFEKILRNLVHASTPVHAGDEVPVRLVTKQGDIGGLSFSLAKQAIVKSGQDLTDMLLLIQHVHQSDFSLVEAARDIKFSSERIPETGQLKTGGNKAKIEVAGGGDLLVKAGRNVDLGSSDGIISVGNTKNPVLPETGADITVMAGVPTQPDYLNFVREMQTFWSSYANDAIVENDFFADLAAIDLDELALLSPFEVYRSIMPRFYEALKLGGTAEAAGNPLGNKLGFSAIEALFPGSDWKGDLNMFFSKIQTVDGGDINLAAPGGGINVGLSVPIDEGNTDEDDLKGIIAQRQGSVNIFLRDNLEVNQSRVFALGGKDDESGDGDILVWSSEGDIDAGRGAKSAISAPPPIIRFDPETGNMIIEFPPVVSGSGVRTAASGDNEAGNVFLFAPKGIINAGEAGIGGNNVILVAKAVLGADNIDVGGVSVGVPQQSSSAPPVTATSNTTSNVSKTAEKSIQSASTKDNDERMALGMLSVEVIGFGSDEEDEEDG